MLKSMFREISDKLNKNDYGKTFAMYQEFAPHADEIEDILQKYDNIGVLYVNNGNLGKLPDGAMMEINYTLELLMRIDDTVNVSDVIIKPIEALAKNVSGKISYNNGAKRAKYFLTAGVASSDGGIVEGINCNYIRYELPLTVVFTDGISIATNDEITITFDGKEPQPLKGVLSVVEVPQVQLDTNTFINDSQSNPDCDGMQNESMVLSASWNIQINKLYMPDEDKDLRNLIVKTPNKVATIKYNDVEHSVVFHDCTFASELGQAEVMTINASTAMRGV
ncbi:MAG: hypothetical protein K2M64_04135 [Clostridia bacterium]|nr:hypothetical protein [Clostridia bacterium]